MLALKVHLIKNLNLSTIIFDEIDTGISRNAAYSVALKLNELSSKKIYSITNKGQEALQTIITLCESIWQKKGQPINKCFPKALKM